MNYYTSDLHFGRKTTFEKERSSNMLFSEGGTPTMEKYTEVVIDNINSRVTPKDTLYILGDVGSMFYCPTEELKRINCRKVLIIGNHDREWIGKSFFRECFVSISPLITLRDEGENIVLCHYPLADWEKSKEGWWHLYGHLHETPQLSAREFMQSLEHCYHVGIDSNNYYPLTMAEIKERLLG